MKKKALNTKLLKMAIKAILNENIFVSTEDFKNKMEDELKKYFSFEIMVCKNSDEAFQVFYADEKTNIRRVIDVHQQLTTIN